jgi:hypothetical protein
LFIFKIFLIYLCLFQYYNIKNHFYKHEYCRGLHPEIIEKKLFIETLRFNIIQQEKIKKKQNQKT